ncbi:integrin alpha beta-propeller repeat protein [Cylindrospermum sp. NIES-4074]|nr:integrin alpha beta-propeller repeat protein [Cylindrospermum sp. NIES-4074]
MSNATSILKVESAGANVGNFARISINGIEIGFGTYTRGLNVAVFDQATGSLLNKASFDTFIQGNAKNFVDFINNIPSGQIVALAVKDDAVYHLFEEPSQQQVIDAFLSIGSLKFRDLRFRDSLALIGQKGAVPGTATEELSATSAVSVTRSFDWSAPPVPLTEKRWLEIQRIFASNPDWSSQFGWSVDTSGQWLIIGAPLHERASVGDGGNDFGAAFIFQLQNDGSWLQTQKLQPSELKAGDRFGTSVAIDGEWAIVGAPYSDVYKPDGGAAYIFKLENNQWNLKQKLDHSQWNNVSDLFGSSVAIDGEWAIVGAYLAEAPNAGDAGAAYIFHLENGVWNPKEKLQPPELRVADWFGWSVAIDGEWAIVGAKLTDNGGVVDVGSAYIFHLENGAWKQKQKLQYSDFKVADYFGQSVAIDGEWALVGAYYANSSAGVVDTGAVYAFRLENGVWQQKQKLQPPDLKVGDYFGVSVAINGNRAVVGASGLEGIHWNNSGGAYIFQLQNGEWHQEYKFVADRHNDEYTTNGNGSSVAITSWGVALLGSYNTWYRTDDSTYGAKGVHYYYGSVYVIGQR